MGAGSIFAKIFSKRATTTAAKGTAKKIIKKEATAGAKLGARSAPVGINTRTVAHTQSPIKSAFSKQAAAAIKAFPVKGVTKTVAYSGAAVAVGGGIYNFSTLGGKGLEKAGYSWRDVTGTQTDADKRDKDLEQREKEQDIKENELDLMKKYAEFLNENQLADSPSARDVFNSYYDRGSAPGGATDNAQSSFGKTAAFGVGALALGGGLAYLLMKKKGGRK